MSPAPNAPRQVRASASFAIASSNSSRCVDQGVHADQAAKAIGSGKAGDSRNHSAECCPHVIAPFVSGCTETSSSPGVARLGPTTSGSSSHRRVNHATALTPASRRIAAADLGADREALEVQKDICALEAFLITTRPERSAAESQFKMRRPSENYCVIQVCDTTSTVSCRSYIAWIGKLREQGFETYHADQGLRG
jgi:hypothetical protein